MFSNQVRYCRGGIPIAALLSFVFLANSVFATTFYPDVMGTNVWFRDISENTQTIGDPEPLYGPPIAMGDVLDFNPNNYGFSASSNDGSVDTTSGAVSLMIEAKPGFTLDTVGIDESGFVNLFTLGGGDPFASVTSLVELTISEIDGVAVVPINLPGVMLSFTPSGGDFQHSVDAAGPQYSSAWQGSADIDLFAELDNRLISYTQGVTKVSLRVDNFLLAAAGGVGSLASIDKNEFVISLGTGVINNIPEPATFGLAVIGLFGAMQMRRRQRQLA
ncbi:MAG: PEP-CTERM sorting domain-containing protein [Planctomycetes bacterium]|nr:PEP-CTERM sorting domain-containing protein [Planctomycetota bacterium]